MSLTVPADDGFYMPAEYAMHTGCIMVWPSRPGSWPFGAKPARVAFRHVIEAISKSEIVYVACGKESYEDANEALKDLIEEDRVRLVELESDDAWARDIGPTFVVGQGTIRAIDWQFNAWGGTYNGLYANWDRDDAFASAFAKYLGVPCYDAHPFVLEGGSIHSDGEGTVLVTKTCLLSPGRNPSLSQEEIEKQLKKYLGAKKVLWLPCGIYQDETDEHVDNVCAFIGPAQVVLAWTDQEDDPQYEMSQAVLSYLSGVTDAKGRKITVHKLPIPDHPILVKESDLNGYLFEEGEDVREVGDRLAASYVNFYFANNAIVMPAFGGENSKSDERAKRILQNLCPDREVICVAATDILLGGGNIHCITQQIPQEDKK